MKKKNKKKVIEEKMNTKKTAKEIKLSIDSLKGKEKRSANQKWRELSKIEAIAAQTKVSIKKALDDSCPRSIGQKIASKKLMVAVAFAKGGKLLEKRESELNTRFGEVGRRSNEGIIVIEALSLLGFLKREEALKIEAKEQKKILAIPTLRDAKAKYDSLPPGVLSNTALYRITTLVKRRIKKAQRQRQKDSIRIHIPIYAKGLLRMVDEKIVGK